MLLSGKESFVGSDSQSSIDFLSSTPFADKTHKAAGRRGAIYRVLHTWALLFPCLVSALCKWKGWWNRFYGPSEQRRGQSVRKTVKIRHNLTRSFSQAWSHSTPTAPTEHFFRSLIYFALMRCSPEFLNNKCGCNCKQYQKTNIFPCRWVICLDFSLLLAVIEQYPLISGSIIAGFPKTTV